MEEVKKGREGSEGVASVRFIDRWMDGWMRLSEERKSVYCFCLLYGWIDR